MKTRIDSERTLAELDARGYALPGRLLAARECEALRRCFGDEARFRSTIEMEPRRYGRGRYRYLAYPLPPLVQKLRENNWNISKTAEALDTPRSNLYKKLEQYGIKQEVDG